MNEGEYTIGYVTRLMFDCDSTMFEYAIMPGDWRNNFYIYRQDGNLLFQKDSTVATWAVGSFSGSYDVRPIVNTPFGTKLFLAKADSMGFFKTVDVYSLCDSLPLNVNFINPLREYLKIYPNPSNSQIHFQFHEINKLKNIELVIYDMIGNIKEREKITINSEEYVLENSNFQCGTYFCRLNSNNRILQTSKFIISK